MTNEDLIEKAIPDSDHTIKYKAELLSRLNRLEELEIYVQQLMGALGYPVSGDIKENPEIVNGIADALRKQLEEAEKEIENLRMLKNVLIEEQDILRTKIDNLKCCGNCDHVWLSEIIEKCKIDEPNFIEKNVCDNWQSDNQTKEERERGKP